MMEKEQRAKELSEQIMISIRQNKFESVAPLRDELADIFNMKKEEVNAIINLCTNSIYGIF